MVILVSVDGHKEQVSLVLLGNGLGNLHLSLHVTNKIKDSVTRLWNNVTRLWNNVTRLWNNVSRAVEQCLEAVEFFKNKELSLKSFYKKLWVKAP